MNRSDHAGHKSEWESHSSPIDTQCCSEWKVIPEGKIPTMVACKIELSKNELNHYPFRDIEPMQDWPCTLD